jgi:hypothetical protein
MAKTATTRRPWTLAQVKTLRSLARKRTHAARIARTLKRTEGATRQKAFSEALSSAGYGTRSQIPTERNFHASEINRGGW